MSRTRKEVRLYWREQGGAKRAYGDFRDYADVGGKREALIAPGEKLATRDKDVAQVLVARRLKDLEARRRGRAMHGITKRATLAWYTREHLIAKAESRQVTERWLAAAETYLGRAIEYFGADRDLTSISVADVRAWAAHLQTVPNGRGGTRGPGTTRHHLNALSNLYRRAQSEGFVIPGYNPVTALLEKPVARRMEAKWLEIPDAALLLESARTYGPAREDIGLACAYPLIATFLLSGGRSAEVRGLEVTDVSFERKTVTFRPNTWRRLKMETSFPVIPLWPQLERMLRDFLSGPDAPTGRLLFPSPCSDPEAMLTDFRKLLDRIAMRVGWKPGEVRSRMFRHTYCAARLQTLDQGAPIGIYTVARELGHGGDAIPRKVYAHLGAVRHRADVVEYHVEPFAAQLAPRLRLLRSAA